MSAEFTQYGCLKPLPITARLTTVQSALSPTSLPAVIMCCSVCFLANCKAGWWGMAGELPQNTCWRLLHGAGMAQDLQHTAPSAAYAAQSVPGYMSFAVAAVCPAVLLA